MEIEDGNETYSTGQDGMYLPHSELLRLLFVRSSRFWRCGARRHITRLMLETCEIWLRLPEEDFPQHQDQAYPTLRRLFLELDGEQAEVDRIEARSRILEQIPISSVQYWQQRGAIDVIGHDELDPSNATLEDDASEAEAEAGSAPMFLEVEENGGDSGWEADDELESNEEDT